MARHAYLCLDDVSENLSNGCKNLFGMDKMHGQTYTPAKVLQLFYWLMTPYYRQPTPITSLVTR